MVTIPLPVIANTFRCAMTWNNPGGIPPATNVIHLRALSPPATASTIEAALDDNVTSAMFGYTSTVAGVNTVVVTPLDGSSASLTVATGRPARWSGTQTGDLLPAPSALVSFYTANRGRSNRGRIFLPFPAEAVVSDGALSPTVVTSMQTAWVTFFTAINTSAIGAHCELVVASYDRKHSGAGAKATSVSSVVVQPWLATQRRRQSRLRFP